MDFPLYDYYAEKCENLPDPSKNDMLRYFNLIKDIKNDIESLSKTEASKREEFLNTILVFILHHHYINNPKQKLKSPPFKGEIPSGGRGIRYIDIDKKLPSDLVKILYYYIKATIEVED